MIETRRQRESAAAFLRSGGAMRLCFAAGRPDPRSVGGQRRAYRPFWYRADGPYPFPAGDFPGIGLVDKPRFGYIIK